MTASFHLYKGGTEGAANTGNRPYSECPYCRSQTKWVSAAYSTDLENWKGILASKVPAVHDVDASFVSIDILLNNTESLS